MAAKQRWVFLADPKAYGWNELVAEKSTVWDGIRNSRAQNNLKKCRKGDEVLIYHTAPDKAITGVARITGEARPDPGNPDLVVVDIEPVRPLARALPLAELKADDILSGMSFVRMPRVAVWPVTDEQWKRVLVASKRR
ncbi:MAG: EVE domain-containing protein [Gemmatimonadota bacterium]|jgi:predicted RNA-binding protein with PUA-like domain